MAATPYNKWGVSYSTIAFFEQALSKHSKVKSFSRRNDILFDIQLITGKEITVLLLDEYTLGLAAVLKALSDFPDAKYIVIGAYWNGYTKEAKEYCDENNIGIFVIGDFFGAIHRKEPMKFYRKDSNGKPIYNYK